MEYRCYAPRELSKPMRQVVLSSLWITQAFRFKGESLMGVQDCQLINVCINSVKQYSRVTLHIFPFCTAGLWDPYRSVPFWPFKTCEIFWSCNVDLAKSHWCPKTQIMHANQKLTRVKIGKIGKLNWNCFAQLA